MLVCTGVHVYVRCAGVDAHACVCELCGCAGVRGCEGVCVLTVFEDTIRPTIRSM